MDYFFNNFVIMVQEFTARITTWRTYIMKDDSRVRMAQLRKRRREAAKKGDAAAQKKLEAIKENDRKRSKNYRKTKARKKKKS